jgi:hypothetical protein
MDRISRPFSSAGNDPYITGELIFMSKIMLLELIDRCSSRATCIFKKNLCMFSYRSSEKQYSISWKTVEGKILIIRVGDKEDQVQSRTSDIQYYWGWAGFLCMVIVMHFALILCRSCLLCRDQKVTHSPIWKLFIFRYIFEEGFCILTSLCIFGLYIVRTQIYASHS